MEVNVETRSAESRLHAPHEAIQDPEASPVATELDQTVVVGGENIEPLPRRRAAGKSKQETDQHLLDELPIFLGCHYLLADLLLSHQSAPREIAKDLGQLSLPGLGPIAVWFEHLQTGEKRKCTSQLVLDVRLAPST